MRKKRLREEAHRDGAPSLAGLLLLPESSLIGGVRIECNANHEAVVEGCNGILEYGEQVIRLTAGGMVVRFSGRSLSIGGMSGGCAIVSGVITAIEFLT